MAMTQENPDHKTLEEKASRTQSVRVDDRGRISLPADLRKVMGVKSGDTLHIRLNHDVVQLVKGPDPFDVLAREALEEFKEGRTHSLRQVAKGMGLDAGGK